MFLKDIKILDLTRLLPGGYCTMLLADLGAEVLKIEDNKMGDYIRWLPPLIDGESAYFSVLNRNKKSMKLNLKKEKGKEIFFKLLKNYDVVIEGFRPGVTDALGIGYNDLSKINERIIYCSITGFGQTGPYKNKAGHDINYIGYSGILDLMGIKDGMPVIPSVQIADIGGGALLSAFAIVSAVLSREKTKKGCYIDISMLDGVIPFLILCFAKYFADNILPKRGEIDLSGGYICYNVYKTKDEKHIALGALEPKFWEGFCKAIGREDLRDVHLVKGKEKEKYYEILQNIFIQKTQKEWIEFFKDKDVCLTPINTIEDVLKDEQIKNREMIIDFELNNKKLKQINFPIKFSNFELEIKLPPPKFGEHTHDVLKNLGYNEDEIMNLQKEDVI